MLRALLVPAVFLALAAPAGAATITASGGVSTYAAAPGEANSVSLTASTTSVSWSGGAITSGAGCALSSCAGPLHAVVADLGDGDDTFLGATAGEGVAVEVDGGPGDDVIDGFAAGESISGGPGTDRLVYAAGAAVSLSLDDVANDTVGASIPFNVHDDIEQIQTGSGPDVLNVRDHKVETVNCGDGQDTVYADATDVLTGCETVNPDLQTPPEAPPRAPAPVPDSPTLKLISYRFSRAHGGTKVRALTVAKPPAGSTIAVRCYGNGCPHIKAVRGAKRAVHLASRFHHVLVKGVVIELSVRAPGYETERLTFTMRGPSRSPRIDRT